MAIRKDDVGGPVPAAPRLKRGSAAWRHLASEVLAERERYPRRSDEDVAGNVSGRMGFRVEITFVREVEKRYGRPQTGGHRPDSTRHALRPARLKHTHNPFAKVISR